MALKFVERNKKYPNAERPGMREVLKVYAGAREIEVTYDDSLSRAQIDKIFEAVAITYRDHSGGKG